MPTLPWMSRDCGLSGGEVVASRSHHDGVQLALLSVNMNGVMPTDFSLLRSVMRSAQVAGGDVIPALAKAALL